MIPINCKSKSAAVKTQKRMRGKRKSQMIHKIKYSFFFRKKKLHAYNFIEIYGFIFEQSFLIHMRIENIQFLIKINHI